MSEDEWLACSSVWDMFGRFRFEASPRKLRLFAVACCRCSRRLLSNGDHRRAVDLAERFADGLATEEELSDAFQLAKKLVSELRAGKTEREIRRWAEAAAVLHATAPPDRGPTAAAETGWHIARAATSQDVDLEMASLLRDIVGNPFRPLSRLRPPDPPWLTPKVIAALGTWPQIPDSWFNPSWLTSTVLALAEGIYAERAFDRLPILADALQDAGCENPDILDHCREPGSHVRGCWVLDLLTGRT